MQSNGREPPRPSEILQISSSVLFPILLLFTAAHVVNASRSPGEGFSSGLLLGLSILLLYIGLGVGAVDRGMPKLARFGITWGFSLCVGLAAIPLLLGHPFLRTYSATIPLPGSELHLSTTLLFEIGIFLILAGGALDLFRSVGLEEDEEFGP